MTRSAASASIAPPPAAVPLSAAITGFWQSWIDSISRWKPVRIMWKAEPTTMSGAPSGFSGIGGRIRRSEPVQKWRSPAPVSTTTRTARFELASWKCSMSRSRT